MKTNMFKPFFSFLLSILSGIFCLANDQVTIGFFPHWEDHENTRNMDFDGYSHIIYHSFELNPKTGDSKNTYDWEYSTALDSFKLHGSKILLSVTNFGTTNNQKFLFNEEARQNFFNVILETLDKREADGINLDFENIPLSAKYKFESFVFELSDRLKSHNSEAMLMVDLEPEDYNKVYANMGLLSSPKVDLFLIMGYDYSDHKYNSHNLAIAPLEIGKERKHSLDLSQTLRLYFEEKLPLEKTVMILPLHGKLWRANSDGSYHEIKVMSHYEINRLYGHKSKRIDSTTHSTIIQISEDSIVSFDSYSSLVFKRNWLLDQGIKGVGYWAVGFANSANIPLQAKAHIPQQEFIPTHSALEEKQEYVASYNIKKALDSFTSKYQWYLLLILGGVLLLSLIFVFVSKLYIPFDNFIWQSPFLSLVLFTLVYIMCLLVLHGYLFINFEVFIGLLVLPVFGLVFKLLDEYYTRE